MKKYSFFFFAFITLLISGAIHAQTDSIVKVTVKAIEKTDSTYTLQAALVLQKDWHVYDDNADGITAPSFNASIESVKFLGPIQFSNTSVTQKDVLFGSAKIFLNKVSFDQEISISGFQPDSLKGNILLNVGKGDQFYALELPYSAALSNGSKAEAFQMVLPASATTAKEDACGETQTGADATAWSVFFLGFLGGLIALITPCVFPMIPMTVSFFTKQSKSKSAGVRNAIFYGVSIIVIYVLLGVLVTWLFGADALNALSTNVWFNLGFFILLVVFAASFLGAFEIMLPNSWANKVDSQADRGGVIGILFMALALAIVSFSCTGPILGTLLVGSLQGGAWALTQGMAGFGLALALPFTLFAIFPQWLQSLPKSGGWLDTVKKVLAFVELALAFKFLSNADLVQHWGLLKREVFIGTWILISIGLSAYLFGFLLLPHDVKGQKIALGRKLFGGLALGFALYLGAGLMPQNANNLKLLSGFPPPTHYSLFASDSSSHGLKADVVNDYTKALAMAKAQQKPILIDFTGWACVNCRKMEEQVWTDPAVQKFIQENYILLSLYVDDRANLPVAERFVYTTQGGQQKQINTVADLWATFETENFNQSSQPLYVVLSPDQVLQSNPIGYTPDIHQYLEWLKCSAKKK